MTQLPGAARRVGAAVHRRQSGARALGSETGFRLLAAEEDLGRELIELLPEERRKVAIIDDTAFPDIVTGNDPKVRPLEIAGPRRRRHERRRAASSCGG